MKIKNVAVFPAGTEIGLEIHNALRFIKDIRLIGIASVIDHSSFVYETIETDAPYINDKDLIEYLKKVIQKYDIEYIFPAHDEAVLVLTEHEEDLNVKVIAPSKETARICRYKSQTYSLLDGFDFIPKIFDSKKLTEEDFPIFIKPDKGQGSNGARLIKAKSELSKIDDIDRFVLCEYLPGEEYTVACVSDHEHHLLYVGQRTRERVKTGISVSSVDVPLDPEIRAIAEKINATLKMRGSWFFQVKKDGKGKFKLLEVAARIAGSMGLHRNQGINFALLSLYIRDKQKVQIIDNKLSYRLDRALISRYDLNFTYKHVYIDFDDTIVIKGKINPFIMHFLYQCKNKDIPVSLITRHEKTIEETLKQWCIDKNIFTEIIHIQDKMPKSAYISNQEAIFIDDSFRERFDVHQTCQIPVFDLDSIESLIDWRM